MVNRIGLDTALAWLDIPLKRLHFGLGTVQACLDLGMPGTVQVEWAAAHICLGTLVGDHCMPVGEQMVLDSGDLE